MGPALMGRGPAAKNSSNSNSERRAERRGDRLLYIEFSLNKSPYFKPNSLVSYPLV